MVAFGSRVSRSRSVGSVGSVGSAGSAGSALADEGFATSSVVASMPVWEEPLVVLPADPGGDEAPPDGPWLDDPAYEVGAFLLGLRDRS